MKKILFAIIALTGLNSFAQLDISSMLEGGATDTQTLLQGYMSPAIEGFNNGITGGWYSTAKTHKPFGLDLKVVANAAIIPQGKLTYIFNNADYTNIQIEDANLSSIELPTVFGSSKLDDRPLLNFTDTNNNTIATSSLPGIFNTEDMLGMNAVPSAAVQLGIGLFKKTDLKIRYAPAMSEKDYKFETFGIGVMHDLKQWFVKETEENKNSRFNLAVFAGLNNLSTTYFTDVDNNPNQRMELDSKSMVYQLVSSYRLLGYKNAFDVSLFGGAGMATYESNVNVLGDYVTTQSNITYTDPIKLKYNDNYFKGNVGLNIKLLLLNISAEYAFQQYNTLSVTAGLSFR